MELQQLANIAEVFGMIVVAITLIFLTVQMRENTRATGSANASTATVLAGSPGEKYSRQKQHGGNDNDSMRRASYEAPLHNVRPWRCPVRRESAREIIISNAIDTVMYTVFIATSTIYRNR